MCSVWLDDFHGTISERSPPRLVIWKNELLCDKYFWDSLNFSMLSSDDGYGTCIDYSRENQRADLKRLHYTSEDFTLL